MKFENKVGPGMLQPGVQQTCVLQECQTTKNLDILSGLSYVTLAFLQNICLLETGLKHSMSDLVS